MTNAIRFYTDKNLFEKCIESYGTDSRGIVASFFDSIVPHFNSKVELGGVYCTVKEIYYTYLDNGYLTIDIFAEAENEGDKMFYYNKNSISFGLIHPDAKLPSKTAENGCYDLYAAFDKDSIIIQPHSVKLIPTGIISAFNPRWRIAFRERGSNTKGNLEVMAGQIDSGYRGEWFVAIQNNNDICVEISKNTDNYVITEDYIIVPYSKAICQFAVEEVPVVEILKLDPEVIRAYASERGTGALGSSGK